MKPLIFDYLVARSECNTNVQYQYDEAESLNVMNIDGVNKPFIDIDASDIDVVTQTRVMRESSDSFFNMSELATKTKIGGEKEDLHDMLLELKTKTLTVREKDE